MAYRPSDSCCFCVCHEGGQITLQAVDNNNMEMSQDGGSQMRKERRAACWRAEYRSVLAELILSSSRGRGLCDQTPFIHRCSYFPPWSVGTGFGDYLVYLFLDSFCVKKVKTCPPRTTLFCHYSVDEQ